MENTDCHYLYGASVQGIQGFIFQTNKLKEIVGASELVEQICTEAFDAFVQDGESIQRAAGGIKCIFNKEQCEHAVLNFPKKVMEMAPGITISQAVVKMEGDYSTFDNAVHELEKRLRTQRNRPVSSLAIGLTGIKRSQSTGLPAVSQDDNKLIDLATQKKRESGKADTIQKLCKNNFGIDKLGANRLAFDVDTINGHHNCRERSSQFYCVTKLNVSVTKTKTFL